MWLCAAGEGTCRLARICRRACARRSPAGHFWRPRLRAAFLRPSALRGGWRVVPRLAGVVPPRSPRPGRRPSSSGGVGWRRPGRGQRRIFLMPRRLAAPKGGFLLGGAGKAASDPGKIYLRYPQRMHFCRASTRGNYVTILLSRWS